ncbi:unnamed protein product [Pseudo-nitzschia multistriata]|uniref:Uncharacterized protein n=1 Tax=Pseudo-nitzschia multistriata TaxID=183589 RepID=A0A448ZI01_9STRA|nr:unnamed protein product [Pseudo-nitzschia multistriata]
MTKEGIPRDGDGDDDDNQAAGVLGVLDGLSDDDDEASDDGFEPAPTLFVLKGVDTSLDEIVLEDCLTRVLSGGYDMGSDETGDADEDAENFLPSFVVTLLETDHGGIAGAVLFCVDRALVLHGERHNDDDDAEGVLARIREYAASGEAGKTDPLWLVGESPSIEVLGEEETARRMAGEEAGAEEPAE